MNLRVRAPRWLAGFNPFRAETQEIDPLRLTWGFASSEFAVEAGGVRIKNGITTRYFIPWTAVLDVDYEQTNIDTDKSESEWCLKFRIPAHVPRRANERGSPHRQPTSEEGRPRWQLARATRVQTKDPRVPGRLWDRGAAAGVSLEAIRAEILAIRAAALAAGADDSDGFSAKGAGSLLWSYPRLRLSLNRSGYWALWIAFLAIATGIAFPIYFWWLDR